MDSRWSTTVVAYIIVDWAAFFEEQMFFNRVKKKEPLFSNYDGRVVRTCTERTYKMQRLCVRPYTIQLR
jgi:hypothetical protein